MKRLDSLDGVRGLLAVYVLLSHMAPFAVLPGWMQDTISHGGAAVDVFFVLSGLVITQSLLHAGGHAARSCGPLGSDFSGIPGRVRGGGGSRAVVLRLRAYAMDRPGQRRPDDLRQKLAAMPGCRRSRRI